jgi:hypothetical protein
MAKVAEIGPKWSMIAQSFPGRTDVGVKNRYISLNGTWKGLPQQAFANRKGLPLIPH